MLTKVTLAVFATVIAVGIVTARADRSNEAEGRVGIAGSPGFFIDGRCMKKCGSDNACYSRCLKGK